MLKNERVAKIIIIFIIMKSGNFILITFLILFVLINQSCDSTILKDSDLEYEGAIIGESEVRATNELSTGEFYVINKKHKAVDGEIIWQAQLDKIKEHTYSSGQNNIKMLSYNYIKRVNDITELDKIKAEIVNKCTFFPKYLNDDFGNFTISNDVFDKDETKYLLDILVPTTVSAKSLVAKGKDNSQVSEPIYLFKENDLGVVNICWDYFGEKFETICIVSENKGIVYDNFLYFLGFPQTKKIVLTPAPRLRTTDFEDPGGDNQCPDGPIQKNFHLFDKAYNYYGIEVWSYDITCDVKGNKINDIKYIERFENMRANKKAVIGWSCAANIQLIEFETGSSEGHLTFAWGYTHGVELNIGLSWNGFGFEITGGGEGSTGVEYYTPEDLTCQ